MPVALNKGTNQEQQCGLWLMEISYQHLYYMILVAWGYYNLCAAMQYLELMSVHPIAKSSKRFNGAYSSLGIVGLPLVYMQFILRGIRILNHFQAHIIKALKRSNTSGTNGYSTAIVSNKLADGITTNRNILSMHLVPLYLFALYGQMQEPQG